MSKKTYSSIHWHINLRGWCLLAIKLSLLILFSRLFTAFHNLWLVAYGEIFSILLDVDNVYILNNTTQQNIVKMSLLRMRKSLRGSSFVGGDVAWLGDCSTMYEQGVVFATGASDHSVHVVEWK